ncbi:MAG: hypothetical protein ACXWUR_01730 [Allosphingosinicella sp.]
MTQMLIRFDRTLGLVAAGALCAGRALPASAQTHANQTQPTSTTSGGSTRADRPNDDRRICVQAEFTNSRISRRICKTASEWEAAGGIPRNDD